MKELASLVEQNEPGCLSYNFYYSPNENTFLVVERFETIEWARESKSN
jgi:quinol monooxygenase YgiN